METVHTPQVLILACGALATEIEDITRLHRLGNVTLECLPGILHNRPTEIPDAVRARLDRAARLRPHPPRVRRLRHGR